MKFRGGILVFLFVLSLIFAGASFEHENHDIGKKYRAGEEIYGWVNISLDNERADSLLRSNFAGNISLFEFLKKNNLKIGEDFECDSINCKTSYMVNNEISNIDLNGKKIIGMKIEGESIESINLFKLTLKSNIKESCTVPLSIELFGNNLSNINYLDKVCSAKNYGCFNNTLGEYSSVVIESSEICEQIVVEPAPAYRIGARVINSTGKKGKLKMNAYDSENNIYSCNLGEHQTNEENLECIIKTGFSNKQNLSVCIVNSAFVSGSNYKLRSETKAPVCGTSGRDFEIFATNLGYNTSETVINDSSFKNFGSSVQELVYEYLEENYLENDKIKCSPCIIPISLSGQEQNIEIKNIEVVFRDSGLSVDDSSYKKLYELNAKPALIDSKGIKVELEHADFVIPIGSKEKRFRLYLNEKVVFEENIEIQESFDFSLNKKFAFVGIDTKFEAITSFNISSSKWDFGDGTIQEVQGKSLTHRFKDSKQYNIKVELKRSDGVIAIKNFVIISGNPKDSANKTLFDYNKRIINLEKEIDKYPVWARVEVKRAIDIPKLNQTINILKLEYNNASDNEDYTRIINSLLELELPISIYSGKKGSVPIEIGTNNMDINYLEEIYSEIQDNQKLKENVIGWMNENYMGSIKFEEIAAVYSNGESEVLANLFEFSISPREGKNKEAYLFIDYPFESIVFEENYGEKSIKEDSGAYISIKPEQQNIKLLILGEISAAELGSYLAPLTKEAVLVDSKEICESDDPRCKIPYPWKKVSLWILIVALGILIIYIILQEWYKRYYEHYLFKDGRDLYNLVNFVYNSRSSGSSDNEIKKSLKNAGWNNERISFAFKKIDGKRTGMWEIPIFKVFENRKVKKELEKRHGGSIDIKFIKQPRF